MYNKKFVLFVVACCSLSVCYADSVEVWKERAEAASPAPAKMVWYKKVIRHYLAEKNIPLAYSSFLDAMCDTKAFFGSKASDTGFNQLNILFSENYPQVMDSVLAARIAQYKEDAVDVCLADFLIEYTEENLFGSNITRAMNCNLRATKILSRLHDSLLSAMAEMQMIQIYQRSGRWEEVKKLLKEVDPDKYGENKKMVADFISGVWASYYINTGKPDSAIWYLRSRLTTPGTLVQKSEYAAQIADLYMMEQKYDSAIHYYDMARPASIAMGNHNRSGWWLLEIGRALSFKGMYKQAIDTIKEALKESEQINFPERMAEGYQALSLSYEALGDYENAYKSRLLYEVQMDTLQQHEARKTLTDMLGKYETEKKDQAIKLKDTQLKQGKLINYGAAGIIILMVLTVFFIYRGYRQKRKDNTLITFQKEEVEKKNAIIEAKNKDILDSIHYAQRIQKALLASDALLKQNLPEYFILFKPKDIVSGDFYWAANHNNRFYLAVCDSTGHGVPGAFMSLLNISYLNEAISEKNITQPNEVFNHARKRLIENISQDGQQDGMDGILCSIQNGTLKYAAAHNPPLLIRNGEVTELVADKIPVGKSPLETTSFTHHTVELQKGDTLYMFTDGYADQFGGPKGKKFMHKQLSEKLKMISEKPMQEQKLMLEETLDNWKGNLEQVDDILIIGIRV